MAQPFDLPDFYMPYPPRLNPLVDVARVRSKEWARRMGMLDAGVWDETTFDGIDLAGLLSATLPEAAQSVLDLVTDWYVWIFFLDDYFLDAFKRIPDQDTAEAFTTRLTAMLSAPAGEPEPDCPVTRGLADVWARTSVVMSPALLRRFRASTEAHLAGLLWELSNIDSGRVPNPIEYVKMRRLPGAGDWATNLIEYADQAELPARVVDTRPVRVLGDSCSDAALLRNDIFSYQRETEDEGEVNNAVLVLERQFGYATQRAADVVNEAITSRMHQFENIVHTELPPLSVEYGLSWDEQAAVRRYVQGLRDHTRGWHDWHLRAGRYMNSGARPVSWSPGGPGGLGTSTARLPTGGWTSAAGMAVRQLGVSGGLGGPAPAGDPAAHEFTLPEFYLPFAVETNPGLARIRRHGTEWARRMGMLDRTVWDEDYFDAMDIGMFTALTHPAADVAEWELANDYYITWTYFDDFFLSFKRTRDLVGARACIERLRSLMTEDLAAMPIPVTTVERAIADLWVRTVPVVSPRLRRDLPRIMIDEFVVNWLWEITNLIQNRVPDPVDYLEMRRKTFGVLVWAGLLRLPSGDALPADIFDTVTMRELTDVFADITALQNDIFSYRKEILDEGELTNGVLSVQRFFGCDLQQAVDVLNDLLTARVRQYEHIVATDLPALCDRFDLDADALRRYTVALERWMSGHLEWYGRSGRFEVGTLPCCPLVRLPQVPTGLGTAATRLARLLAR